MTHPVTNIPTQTIAENLTATKEIFTTDRSMLDMTLEENGIATIDIDNRDDNDSSETASTVSNEDELDLARFAALNLGSPSDGTATEGSDSTTIVASSRWGNGNYQSGPYRERSSGPAISYISLPSPIPDESLYIELLQTVITAAREATIPTHNAPDQVRTSALAANHHRFRFHGFSKNERDYMIGAAGELYVSRPHKKKDLPVPDC